MFETNLTEMENLTIEHLPVNISGYMNGTTPVNLTIPDNLTVVITDIPYQGLILELQIAIFVILVVITFILMLLLIKRRRVIL